MAAKATTAVLLSRRISLTVLAWRARRDGHSRPLPVPPAWVDRLQAFNPVRVVFAHDHSVWEP
jgi:N-acyl homoserine lactone hydrolase